MAQFTLNPNILKNVPLFSSFSDQQLALLAPAVQHRRFGRGSYVIRAGEETDALYIILAGHAKVLIPDDDGNEVILSMVGPNDFFGEMGLLDDAPRNADVIAETRVTLMILRGSSLKELERECPQLARRISRSVTHRRDWLEPVS
jgi:CRP/FNR family transcriptional regulator, cyclic AMP receptor protein